MPGVKTIQFPEIPVKGLGVFLYYLRCCLHILWNKNYDLIHLHKTDGAFFLPLLCLKYKVIATSHALPYLNEKWSSIGKLYFRLTEWLFIRSAATLTAIAKTQVEHFEKKYHRPVRFIPNGIHLPDYVDPTKADKILHPLNIHDNYLFFAARRVIPLKGCHTFIKALQKINYQGPVIIAGELEQLPEYTKKLRSLAQGLNIHFIGYVAGMDKLNALLSRAKFFVFPSELEGMSMMLLEAGCLGTPMICSDIPQNKAVLSSQEVLYFESKNVDDLSNKLSWAIANEKAMQALAECAKQSIQNNYTVDKVVQDYINLYEQTLYPNKIVTSINKL
jgi:glycosyltransferase involved in cell wall biosynthesis